MDIAIEPVSTDSTITRVTLGGRIDAYTVEEVSAQMNSLLRIGAYKLICNLSAVEFVSSQGLKVFVGVTEFARSNGGDCHFYGLHPDVERTFQSFGLHSVARTFPDEISAVREFTHPGSGPGSDMPETMIGVAPDAFAPTMIGSVDPGAMAPTMIGPVSPPDDFEVAPTSIGPADPAPSPSEDVIVKVHCPQCGQKVSGDASFYGTTVSCPVCDTEIQFPSGPGSDAGALPASGASAPGQTTIPMQRSEKQQDPGAVVDVRPRFYPVELSLPPDPVHLVALPPLVDSLGRLVGVAPSKLTQLHAAAQEVGLYLCGRLAASERLAITIEGGEGSMLVALAIPSLDSQLHDFLHRQGEGRVPPGETVKSWLERSVDKVEATLELDRSQIRLVAEGLG